MKLRVYNDVVIEILKPIPGFTIEQSFHPDLLAACFDWDGQAEVGWIHNGNGTFRHPDAPAPEPAPTPEPEPVPVETPVEPPVEGA